MVLIRGSIKKSRVVNFTVCEISQKNLILTKGGISIQLWPSIMQAYTSKSALRIFFFQALWNDRAQ